MNSRSKQNLKSFLREWLPSGALRKIEAIRQLLGFGICFHGDFATWPEAAAGCTGYDAEEILGKVYDATVKVIRGEAAYERDSVLFYDPDNVWPVLAALMWGAARNSGKLDVLDFGGALGSSYFQYQRFLRPLPHVRWNVVEQRHYVLAGQALPVGQGSLHFYSSVEDCFLASHPKVFFLSGVLQYLEHPEEILSSLANRGGMLLIIDRTPLSKCQEDTFVVQKTPSSIYKASYPMRIFSESKLMDMLNKNWQMVSSHICPEGAVRTTRGLNFSFQGMILESHP